MYSSVLDVSLDSIEKNLRLIKDFLGGNTKVCAVMKSDAYGLGVPGVAGAMISGGADVIGVARCQEAREIKRSLGGESPVPLFIMGLCADGELEVALEEGFVVTLDSFAQADLLSRLAVERDLTARVHIKIDTGFSRLGLKASEPESLEIYESISRLPHLSIQGTFSHLALADGVEDARQFHRFTQFCNKLEQRGISTGIKHICDSIGTVRYPQYHLDMVRPGAILYGMKPFRAPLADDMPLEFPARWTSRIIHVTRLEEGEGVSYDYSWRAPAGGALAATVPVGYSDGYPRSLSQKGKVCIGGVICPVIGLICMDQMVVDASAVPSVKRGDEVELLGDTIGILELAEGASTNRNEVLARLGRRVLRRYWKKGKAVSELAYLDEPSFREI